MDTQQEMNKMETSLATMKRAFASSPMPSLNTRIGMLKNLKTALIEYTGKISSAMSDDYGKRSEIDTLIADIAPCIANINHTVGHLHEWMEPSKRDSGPLLSTASVEVIYQPLGVVGIVVPWNFPVMLSIGPLISAIAAGNRAMLKMSEFTPHTNKVLGEMLQSVFDEAYVNVFEGEAEVSAAFTALPFDHILFTGSTTVGRHVMRAAAANLTPVTLELGGKSPVIVADDVSMEMAVERIIYGKSLNNGQVCVAPDYVFLPEGRVESFIAEYKKQYGDLFPDGVDSENLTSMANTRQFNRIEGLLNGETEKQTRIEPCHGNSRDNAKNRLVTHMIVDPAKDSEVMTEEIFGPLLPLIPYGDVQEAMAYIQGNPRPLALYLMTFDEDLQQQVKTTVHSGGMCINDSVFHLAVDDAPFGGVGESGMGNYHGFEGFLTLSHSKTVMTSGTKHNIKHLFAKDDNAFKKAVLEAMLR
ncbi:coniferyl aldehyde dehydrogenase [Desulfoluna spongiiphila]|uniref:Aldehyde dehydrogenase n=1 Tax=Desulfoluna spongiiphila TaxID=419481 RepID=A0A1G5F3R4_9BACT|nr:coniferyl aldehyde dehydrogenase [Desulfoluna spongiiphila]SCY33847.1 coniferyl-aldehyde dehydrogenase [Desulfoluna spongiiphila]